MYTNQDLLVEKRWVWNGIVCSTLYVNVINLVVDWFRLVSVNDGRWYCFKILVIIGVLGGMERNPFRLKILQEKKQVKTELCWHLDVVLLIVCVCFSVPSMD